VRPYQHVLQRGGRRAPTPLSHHAVDPSPHFLTIVVENGDAHSTLCVVSFFNAGNLSLNSKALGLILFDRSMNKNTSPPARARTVHTCVCARAMCVCVCSPPVDGMHGEARNRQNVTTDDLPCTRGQAQHCLSGMPSVQYPDFRVHQRGHQTCGLAIR